MVDSLHSVTSTLMRSISTSMFLSKFNINAETIFKAQMGTKVGDALEVKRKEYSNTFVKTKEETDEV